MPPAARHAHRTRGGNARWHRAAAALATIAAATATFVAVAGPGPNPDARSYAVAQTDKPTSPGATTPPPATGAYAPLDISQLQMLVPERIGAWKRGNVAVPQFRKRGLLRDGPSVVYEFRHGRQHASLTLSDLGGMSGAARLAQWKPGDPSEQETATGSEKVYRDGRHTVREVRTTGSKTREVNLVLENGIVVVATSDDADFGALKALADATAPGAEAIARTPR